MSTRYFDIVTSESAFGTQLKAELKINGALSIDDLQSSGSNWGRRQLLACQVIVSPTAHNRRLRDLTPDLWFEDPYLVCILLSLAQLQWQRRKTTPEAFFVRLLVTNASDTTHAHVFQADIPSKLLHALDNPTEDKDNLVWPAIQHFQVPFDPHASFSERIAGQLLAGLKTRAEEEMPRGEKRKRDEMDTEEQTQSVKAWDGAVQVAGVPLANG
ncbi:hypothetical protein Forpi1262_v011084 [Fusarium oxysporum f. sp. raphani]|uniref:Uncharacterized protein n=1 Tax=Fusarium oxysporum f. sp. raphani TaxID=96318 RepID=A0A8J5PXB2_FUSOX|nr:hypothetical protein Forpi1262_v011084 [Fusarium oxysporum f. sp. raphani]